MSATPHNAADDLRFEQIEVGQVFECERVFAAEDVDTFAAISGDFSPLHMDGGYARESGHTDRVVHGFLTASLFSQLVGMRIPGKSALYMGQDLAFRRPAVIGEPLRVSMRVTGKNAWTQTILLASEIRNAEGSVVVSGSAKVKVRGDAARPEMALPPESPVSARPDRTVALVCGSSRGIGASIARVLAARGMAIAVTYFRSADGAQALADKIVAAGGEAIPVSIDVREMASVQEMVNVVESRFGGLDKVVNGAIGELVARSITELDWAALEKHMDTQVRGVLNVAQACYPLLRRRAGASMVNILSQVTIGVPPVQMADYVTAKYALKGLSKALAVEWAADGIRVNTVSPGLIQTELTVHYQERVFRTEASRTPLKRIATPTDVANTVAYLLSDEASFLTGVDVPITGGQVMP